MRWILVGLFPVVCSVLAGACGPVAIGVGLGAASSGSNSSVSAPVFVGGTRLSPGPVSYIAAFEVVDLDANGLADVVTANERSPSADDLSIFLQTQPGRFSGPIQARGGGAIVSPRAIASGDIDGDGAVDLASADAGPNLSAGVVSLLFARSGQFVRFELNGGPWTCSPVRLFLEDVNRDGRTDVQVAIAGGLTVFVQDGSGSFVPPEHYRSRMVSEPARQRRRGTWMVTGFSILCSPRIRTGWFRSWDEPGRVPYSTRRDGRRELQRSDC